MKREDIALSKNGEFILAETGELLNMFGNDPASEVIDVVGDVVIYYTKQTELLKSMNKRVVLALNIKSGNCKKLFSCEEKLQDVYVLENTAFVLSVENGVSHVCVVKCNSEVETDLVRLSCSGISIKAVKNPITVGGKAGTTILVGRRSTESGIEDLCAMNFIESACSIWAFVSDRRLCVDLDTDEDNATNKKLVTGDAVEKNGKWCMPVGFGGAVYKLYFTEKEISLRLYMDMQDQFNFSDFENIEIVEDTEYEHDVKVTSKDGLESVVKTSITIS